MRRSLFLAAVLGSVAGGASCEEIETDVFDPPSTRYATGAVKSRSDDERGVSTLPRFRAFLPVRMDLSPFFPKPGNQLQLGSCASWAVGYAARSYYTRRWQRLELTADHIPSPLYLYTKARSGECDSGSSIAANIRVLQKGAASLKEVPYTSSCSIPKSAESAYSDAFDVDGYFHLADPTNPDEIKGQIARGDPVIVSVPVDDAFQGHRGRSVIVASEANKEKDVWHAVTIVGYDDTRQAFRFINSWGRGWGDNGYGWFSYDFIRDNIREAAVLKVDKAPVLPDPPRPVPTPSPSPAPLPPVAQEEAERLLESLGTYNCSSLKVVEEGGTRIISGFVSDELDRRRIEAQASIADGVAVQGLNVVLWPLCETLLTLGSAAEASEPPVIDIHHDSEYRRGDSLEIEVRSPPHFSYTYVSYFQNDGTVVHLYEPEGIPLQEDGPNTLMKFGDGKDGRSRFVVAPPFGDESILVLSSRSPLFDEPLPDVQPDREFLSELRKALVYKPIASLPNRVVSASYVKITTKEK